MMLDDFFTLTERNHGLTVPSRVMELVDVMQKESVPVVNDVGEVTRQWSVVASALAATENQECISLFVHLDGIHFIGKWLQDALKFGTISTDSCLEDTIAHLLQALKKLHIDNCKMVSSELLTIVKELIVHSSLKIQGKAKMLFEAWEGRKNADASPSDVIEASTEINVQNIRDTMRVSGHSASSLVDKTVPLETSAKGLYEEEKGVEHSSMSCDEVNPSRVAVSQDLDKIHSSRDDERPLVHVRPPLLMPSCSSAINVVESCDTASSSHDISVSEIPATTDTKNIEATETLSADVGIIEGLKISDNNPPHLSSASSNPLASVTEPSSRKFESMDHSISANQSRISSPSTMEERAQCSTSLKPYCDKSRESIKNKTPNDRVKSKKPERQVSGHNIKNFKFLKTEARECNIADKIHDIDIYGIVDPLELARQVAIEVQREVVESRDQSCSSSEKHAEDNEEDVYSQNSESGRQSKASQGSLKGEFDTVSDETSLMREESASIIENSEVDQENEAPDMDNSLVTEVSQEENAEKLFCNFDLNQELSSEDIDDPGHHLLAPVSVVPASAAEKSLGLPVAPLQFEGNTGWKGSAATSAFRPAIHKMQENDTDLSTGRSITSSKQRQGFLDIDLNAVEITDGKMGGLLSAKKLPTLMNITSGECSTGTNQIRPEQFKLDLNLFSEDSNFPSDLNVGQFSHGNSYGQSHMSSGPRKQPFLMGFDLNDQPSFLGGISDRSSFNKSPQTLSVPGGMKPEDSVISIMGTRVKVSQKDLVSPNTSMPSLQTSELPFDVNMGRGGSFLGTGSVLPYNHFPGYSYQNIASGHGMPFNSTIYTPGGSVPYMVDSRGAPVIPQLIAPATTLPTGFSQIPFFMNMPQGQGPSNRVASVPQLQGGFDLNGRSMVEAGGSRDPGGFTQFLSLGQVRPTEEHLRSNHLPSFSSFVTGKRKEPENAWEQQPFKHHTWK